MLIGRHENVIVVAGSSIGPGLFEERTSYSNFGAIVPPAGLNGPQEYAEIDFCAPTNHHVAGTGITVNDPHYFHFPPINRGVFTADLIGRPLVVDAVGAGGAAPGHAHRFFRIEKCLCRRNPCRGEFDRGCAVFFYCQRQHQHINGNPVANQANITVNNIAGFATALRDVLKYNHFNGKAVRGGNAAMSDAFSDTSAACPFACGVLALVLSANPNLSFWEARDILKRTAIPIDLRLRSATLGQNVAWVDLAGDPLVDANG